MGMIGKIAKAGALMFAVGVLLALAAPVLAEVIGADLLGSAAFNHALTTPVLWTGAFFGAFGAIHAAIQPVFDKIFGNEAKIEQPSAARVLEAKALVAPSLEHEREQSRYREIEDKKRATQPSSVPQR